MTLTVAHATLTGAIADTTALVDGPKWDANHSLTGAASPSQGGTGVVNSDASTITITGSFGLTFTISAATSLTFPTTGTVATTSNKLSAFAATTSAELAGVISDETGSGVLVFATSPTLVTPVLGVAAATSINKVAITAPATSATITVANGKTLTASNTLTFTGTDASSVAFGAGGTVAYAGINNNFTAVQTITANADAALSGVTVTNNSAGTSAQSVFRASNGTSDIVFGMRGTAQSSYGILTAGRAYIYGASDFSLMSDGGDIIFASGGSAETARIGTSSGDFKAIGSILSTSPTRGVGYKAGAGGTVTQPTSKSTGATLNTVCGAVTMNNAALAAATIVSFVLTNSAIAATDVVVLNHISGGTMGSYTLNARAAAGSATIDVRNNTAGSLSEAIVIQFAVIKGVNA